MDYCGSQLEGIIQYHCQGDMMVDGGLAGHVPSLSGNRKDNECGSLACILLFIQSGLPPMECRYPHLENAYSF